MRIILLTLLTLAIVLPGKAQRHNNSAHHTRELVFPDIPGYQTMTTDLHTHSVFSDGKVWPDIRVKEALRDNLDAICISDHIEYLPHKKDIPPVDRNRSFEIALEEARGSDLIVIRGAELTRELPPGHCNALFLQDANSMVADSALQQFKIAQDQRAFVFWNHPSWEGQQPSTLAVLTAMHKQLIEKKMLHGIEVVNGGMYSENALQIALDNNLTIMGTSDIHELIDWDYDTENGGHRPATLVFVKDRSAGGIREGLFGGRTIAVYRDYLIGREEYMYPLLNKIISVEKVHVPSDANVISITLRNNSSVNIILANRSEYSFHQQTDVLLLPHLGELTFWVQSGQKMDEVELQFEVLSAIIAPKTHPVLTIHGVPGKH